jgi:hypothetical protein
MSCSSASSSDKSLYFDAIDTEDKAYVLGWIMCRGDFSVDNKMLRISAEGTRLEALQRIHHALCDEDSEITMKRNGSIVLSLSCEHQVAALRKLLEATDG